MLKLSWISILVLIVDQVSKKLAAAYLVDHPGVAVTSFLNLVLVYNTGAAFGFLNDAGGWQNAFFVVITIVVCVVILTILRRLNASDIQIAVALVLILGGALGNLFDRVLLGYVIDFIDLYYRSWHWWTFNIADSAITIGAALLIMDALGLNFRRRSL